ncbi:MAG: M4 family metallopeptidase [Nitrospiraceae bacterium]|nr:M4 family metallopeptidase [Nitrospiraceae bacterium]
MLSFLRRFCRTSPFGVVFSLALAIIVASTAWAGGTASPLIDELSRSTRGQVDVSYHSATGLVRFLHLKQPDRSSQIRALSTGGNRAETRARDFLGRYGELFGLTDQSRELSVERTKTEEGGRSFVRFQQKIGDIPVFGGELIVQTDSSGGVVSVSGKTTPHLVVDTQPSIDSSVAVEKALQLAGKNYLLDRAALTATTPELWIYNPSLLGSGPNVNKLVWRVEIRTVDIRPINELVLVDAHTGSVALHFNQTRFAKSRIIYDNNDTVAGLPGLGPVRVEGQAVTGITDVDNAYNYAGLTYDFYHDVLGRDSIDNAGMPLISTVRYCDGIQPCPLADVYWDTTHEQMVYGQGYASALDIVAHEMTHGVIQHTSRLFNYMQSGAVSESLSDVFGKLVQLKYESFAPADLWLIGKNLPGGPLRNMQNPASYIGGSWFNDPDSMTSTYYYCSSLGTDGLHRNAGVNNKAAYLMVDGSAAEPGGTFNTYTGAGIGADKVAKIYYEAQTNLLTSGSDYEDLYYSLQLACENLTGTSGIASGDCQQVKSVLDAVQMNQQPVSCAAPEAPLCGAGFVPGDVFFDNLENGGSNWTTSFVTGANAWIVPATSYATSGVNSIWGQDLGILSRSYITMKSGRTLPTAAFLHFNHAYDFDADTAIPEYYDGGVLEYSVNGGPWTDALAGAGILPAVNGYNGILVPPSVSPDNPFAGRSAFVGTSYGYISSRLDLSSLSGQSVKFRFGIGTDSSFGASGWYIDDIRIYTCVTPVATTVDSFPHGLRILVDGISYTTPHTFSWADGSTHTLNAVSPQDGGAGIQYAYSSWDDSGTQSHPIIIDSASRSTYTATFNKSAYELVSSVSPADAGFITPDCSLGCWYQSGATASLTAVTGSSGYVFSSWSGDCSGSLTNVATVLMSGTPWPKSCTANFSNACDIVRIGSTPYVSMQAAFDAPPQPNDIVKVAATTLYEPLLNYHGGVLITLSGGYDCGGSTNSASAYSALIGSLTITNGTITVENLIIK